MSSAEPGGETASPVDCGVCGHNGKYTQCPGCGGQVGFGKWPPCTFCRAVIGTDNPPPPPMMPPEEVITSWGFSMQTGSPPTYSVGLESIEATEPRTLPPLEAFAAEAAVERREPIEGVIEELEFQREAIRDLSRRITELTQAVLGRNLGS